MKQEIKINTLKSWATPVQYILEEIADFNRKQMGCTIDSHEDYIRRYNNYMPKDCKYLTKRLDADTLEVWAEDKLLLSITMCEVHELVTTNEYY